MRPGTLTVSDKSIFFEIFADVEDVYRPDDQAMEPQLLAEERANLVSLWENWDSLLSYLVVTISRKTLSESEQQILIDTLLETRYRFVQDLNDNTLSHDIVREQFVAAWQQLSPIFKNHLKTKCGAEQGRGMCPLYLPLDPPVKPPFAGFLFFCIQLFIK